MRRSILLLGLVCLSVAALGTGWGTALNLATLNVKTQAPRAKSKPDNPGFSILDALLWQSPLRYSTLGETEAAPPATYARIPKIGKGLADYTALALIAPTEQPAFVLTKAMSLDGLATAPIFAQIQALDLIPTFPQSFFTKKTAKEKKPVHQSARRTATPAKKTRVIQRQPPTAVTAVAFPTLNATELPKSKPSALPAYATLFVAFAPDTFAVPGVPEAPSEVVAKKNKPVKPVRQKEAAPKKTTKVELPRAEKAATPKVTAAPVASVKEVAKPAKDVAKPVKDKVTRPVLDIVDTSATRNAPVPSVADKYALIIGNADSRIDGAALPYAVDDAQLIRETLTNHAGYPDANIETVTNGTASQILAAANALALRVPDKATVLIYFTGVGENIEGLDYLAGVDTPAQDAVGSMLSKDALFKAFLSRGARVFGFFQANRPIRDGIFFGSETNSEGAVAQMQATVPGGKIYSTTSNGKQIGLFTNGVVATLVDSHANQNAIVAFGWQVYYNLRRNGTGTALGSSAQSPSLPVLTNMASDARF